MAAEEEGRFGRLDAAIKKFGYTKSLLLIFVVPFLFLIKPILRRVQKKPFFLSIAVVCALGWAWSMLLSKLGWWNFPDEYIIGIRVLPHLPLEEFIIYPIGGAFSIFFYVLFSRKIPGNPRPAAYFSFLALVTLPFVVLAVTHADHRPYYLYSQFALYNALCFVLAFPIAKHMRLSGVLGSVLVLGAIGYGWDFLAFRYGWWVYNAITGVKINGIPIEDVNFYLLAPTAAISLYVGLCRVFKLNQLPDH